MFLSLYFVPEACGEWKQHLQCPYLACPSSCHCIATGVLFGCAYEFSYDGGFDDLAALVSWSRPFWSVHTEVPSNVFLIA